METSFWARISSQFAYISYQGRRGCASNKKDVHVSLPGGKVDAHITIVLCM